MTAEDIYELVKVDYPEIGLATVYRTVQLLLELQLVDRINLDDGCVRYEIGTLIEGQGRKASSSSFDMIKVVEKYGLLKMIS